MSNNDDKALKRAAQYFAGKAKADEAAIAISMAIHPGETVLPRQLDRLTHQNLADGLTAAGAELAALRAENENLKQENKRLQDAFATASAKKTTKAGKTLFLVDGSGSMAWPLRQQKPSPIETAQVALIDLQKTYGDKMDVFFFGNSSGLVRIYLDPKDPNFKYGLRCGTDLFPALTQLNGMDPMPYDRVIILSDGDAVDRRNLVEQEIKILQSKLAQPISLVKIVPSKDRTCAVDSLQGVQLVSFVPGGEKTLADELRALMPKPPQKPKASAAPSV